MKKILCYFGIVVLLGFILFPPALRIFLPEKKEIQETPQSVSSSLVCTSDYFISNTRYENNKVQMIIMKKIDIINSEDDDLQENISIDNELTKSFDELKDKNDVIYNNLDDGEAISIDFTLSEHANLDLKNFIKEIDEQQKYYESFDLICQIR